MKASRTRAVAVPLDGEAAGLVLPRDAVEVEQVGEHLLAGVGEHLLAQRDVGGGHDAEARQPQPHLELQLRLGGGGEGGRALRGPAVRTAAPINSAIWSEVSALGIEHQVEEVGGGAGLAESGLALRALGGLEFEQQLARGGPLQPIVDHQVADADVLRRHHVHAQRCRESAGRCSSPPNAQIYQVVLGREPGEDGSDQAGPGLVGESATRRRTPRSMSERMRDCVSSSKPSRCAANRATSSYRQPGCPETAISPMSPSS